MKTWVMRGGVAVAILALASVARAEMVLMSSDWGVKACEAWNAEPVLTGELVESGWIANDKDRGHKILHVYRTDCADSPRVELRVVEQDGQAKCVYGGKVENEPDTDVDYIMHAKTKRWLQMGNGDYGPMWAMMSFRLKFSGPKMEAMNNMGPFKKFLLLVGQVPSSAESCP
jgi:putative sterol carrier protein